MKTLHEHTISRTSAVCCDLAADALVRVSLDALPERRRQPGPACSEPLPASFLKHADEQTVAGLSAVYTAIHRAGLETTAFQDWGVVAAPRFLGRPAMAAALQRFQTEGAWGVSPHLIPHRSLHSISGTVSQALKIHGPNFGVGGGPGGVAEALLSSVAMLEGQKLPGVWLVLTALNPEQAPDEAGHPAAGTQCLGLALALVPLRARHAGLRLRLVCGSASEEPLPGATKQVDAEGGLDLSRLFSLLEQLRDGTGTESRIIARLDAASRLELSQTADPQTWIRGSAPWQLIRGGCAFDSTFVIPHSRATTGAESLP